VKTSHALFLVVSMILTACGTATVARRDATGGQIALSGGYMPAMRAARTLMAEDCHGAFDVSDFQHGLHYRCQAKSRPMLVTMVNR
jgi:hypothetical protein